MARAEVTEERVLPRAVEVDCDRLGVVDLVVLEDAPDLLGACLHTVEVDHVVDSPEMAIVAIPETLEPVSVTPEYFSVPAFRDVVVVLFVVVVIQQLGREADRWRNEEQFPTGSPMAPIQTLSV